MSKLHVEVCKINKIETHPNADRLRIATIKGFQCIIGLSDFNTGDFVVYCPPDSLIPSNLIEKYKLDYLSKNGRVKTTKLRGYISQGLILSIPQPMGASWKEGLDVATIMGITKYEQPQPKYQQFKNHDTIKKYFLKYVNKEITLRRFIFKSTGIIKDTFFKKKKNINPLFSKYTDMDNYRHYPAIFTPENTIVILEKIHGCLQAKTKISLEDGSVKTIKEIVDNRLDIKILGYDKNNKIAPTKILNYYNNGITNDWYSIHFTRKGLSKGNSFGQVTCTSNHKFWNPIENKYVQLKNLKINDCILVKRKIPHLSEQIFQVMIGKMLGDGTLCKNSIQFSHKKEHEQYLNHTLKSLGYFAGNQQKNQISGYGTTMVRARTISSYLIKESFKNWFINRKKEVPNGIILTPISLAFWYMDDGSLMTHFDQEDRVNFATCNFNERSIDNLIKALERFNIKGTKSFTDNKYWRIRLNSDEADKFFTLIIPYIPKCMQYKLPKYYRGQIPIEIKGSEYYKQVYTTQKILEIVKKDTKKLNKGKYDLETETHNFFANDCLVHNSNFRAGTLERYNKSLWGKIKSFLFGKYEFVYGSHKVQITGHRGRNCFYGEDVYGQMAKKYNLAEIIPQDYIIYGEIFGSKIQDLEYGLKDSIDIVFFDAKYKDKYLDWEDFVEFCYKRNLPIVPSLYVGKFNKKIIDYFVNGKTTLNNANHIREGIVIRPLIEAWSPKIGRKMLKYKSDTYLTRKGATEFK